MWESEVAAVNLGVCAPAPLLFFIARAMGAHQLDGLGAPDQGTVRESDSASLGRVARSIPTRRAGQNMLGLGAGARADLDPSWNDVLAST